MGGSSHDASQILQVAYQLQLLEDIAVIELRDTRLLDQIELSEMSPDTTSDVANPLVSVLVAAYNEEATLEQVLYKVNSLPFESELVVVDDGSKDSTWEILTRLAEELPNLRPIQHEKNSGKGAAIRTAIQNSTGDIVVIQDADLEYDPDDLPRLLEPLFQGRANVVYGTRLRGGEPQRAHLFWHYLGNRFLSLITNILYNTTISDMEVGYKAFEGDLIRSIPLESNDFRIEPEMTAKVLRLKPQVRLFEVPISYYGRTFEEGKKITWRDGFFALAALIRYRF